ncbi:MAG TPA: hypothetical protein VF457_08570 [Burkholderiaceae bacterium]
MNRDIDFDLQAAWLRRFGADAEGNLRAFALRLKEALPEHVRIEERKGFFSSRAKTVGVSVELGEHRYVLQLADGRLQASIALVVRDIALNTKRVDPAEWFARLAEETRQASEQARSLSRSISDFMAT